jgi:predicted dinucleotide-utilizing enzyme
MSIRVGIIGFGSLGQFLFHRIQTDVAAKAAGLEVAFVWNRTTDKLQPPAGVEYDAAAHGTTLPSPDQILTAIDDEAAIRAYRPDVLVEVAHPNLYRAHGAMWLRVAHVFVGSPTAFADAELVATLQAELAKLAQAAPTPVAPQRVLYVPKGALWGAEDIAAMAARGTIASLHITMRKPASSTRLGEPLQSKLDAFLAASGDDDELVVYDGPIGPLCPLAPNNVNTMACAALASGAAVGFANGRGTLIVDRNSDCHIITVTVEGKLLPGRSKPFSATSTRVNPCDPGAVTATATFVSFFSSMCGCARRVGLSRAAAAAAAAATAPAATANTNAAAVVALPIEFC